METAQFEENVLRFAKKFWCSLEMVFAFFQKRVNALIGRWNIFKLVVT